MPDVRDAKPAPSATSLTLLATIAVAAASIVSAWMVADARSADDSRGSRPTSTTTTSTTTTRPPTTADPRTLRPIDRPGHVRWIVNKQRPLPKEYVPANLVVPNVELRLEPTKERMHLRPPAARAVERLFRDAASDGVLLRLISGFRSFESQAELYAAYLERDGRAVADQYSARPGTSEHQTGLAADVGLLSGEFDTEVGFGMTPEGRWVADNAHRFGFIVRYPPGKQHITGYTYEPWHLRYVGKRLASTLYRSGETMEEYFGLVRPTMPTSTSSPARRSVIRRSTTAGP